jgi:hypothetical protein
MDLGLRIVPVAIPVVIRQVELQTYRNRQLLGLRKEGPGLAKQQLLTAVQIHQRDLTRLAMLMAKQGLLLQTCQRRHFVTVEQELRIQAVELEQLHKKAIATELVPHKLVIRLRLEVTIVPLGKGCTRTNSLPSPPSVCL